MGRANRLGVTFNGPHSNQHRKAMASVRTGYKPTWQNGERIKRPKTNKRTLRGLMPPDGWLPGLEDNLRPVKLVEPPPGTKTLMELAAGECKFPYGDGPFFFCAAPTGNDDDPYCSFHDRCTHSSSMVLTEEERQRRRVQSIINVRTARSKGRRLHGTFNPNGVSKYLLEA